MSDLEHDDVRGLSEAFVSSGEGARPTVSCPEPEALWEAARGALDPEQARAVVDHMSGCPVCAEAWRVAIMLDAAAEEEEEGHSDTEVSESLHDEREGRGVPWAVLGAVAVAAGLVLLIVPTDVDVGVGEDERSVYRSPEHGGIAAVGPARIPAAQLELAWTPVEGAVHYEVELLTPELDRVAGAKKLEQPRWKVPQAALEDLGSPARLLWRVEAVTQDGRRIGSDTFNVVVE